MLDLPALLVEQATGTSSSPALDLFGYILQFGLVGLILIDVALTHKFFVPAWVNREKDKRIEQLETSLEQMTDKFLTEVVPALTNASIVGKEYVETLQRISRDHG